MNNLQVRLATALARKASPIVLGLFLSEAILRYQDWQLDQGNAPGSAMAGMYDLLDFLEERHEEQNLQRAS